MDTGGGNLISRQFIATVDTHYVIKADSRRNLLVINISSDSMFDLALTPNDVEPTLDTWMTNIVKEKTPITLNTIGEVHFKDTSASGSESFQFVSDYPLIIEEVT